MKSNLDVLAKLKSKRSQNIADVQSWSDDDALEMISTYKTAKDIAVESNDAEAIAILEEKISQLEEALVLKKQNQDINL